MLAHWCSVTHEMDDLLKAGKSIGDRCCNTFRESKQKICVALPLDMTEQLQAEAAEQIGAEFEVARAEIEQKVTVDINLPSVLADLESVTVFLQVTAARTFTMPHVVDKAIQHIEAPAQRQFLEELVETDLFQHSWAFVKHRVQRFEQDKIADAKLVAALHFITGEQILKSEMVTTSEGRMYARILNAAQIHSLKVVDILQDSLDMVSEAYSLWSPRGRDDSVRQVKSWMSAVIEVSDVLDTSITSSMCSRLHNSNWVFPQDTPVRPERIDGFLDESAFANFFEHIEKITAHWDADFAVSVGMEAFLSSTRRFDPNIRIRTAIRELCNAQAMCCPDESPEVLLADWRAKLSTDQPSGISSLFQVHGLSELLHDLVSQYKPAGNQTIPAGLEIQLVPGPRFEEIDDDEELPRKTVVAVADMANRVLDGAWGTIARNTLESCVGALSKELMNELALPAIVFPSNVLPRMVSVEPSPAHFARAMCPRKHVLEKFNVVEKEDDGMDYFCDYC